MKKIFKSVFLIIKKSRLKRKIARYKSSIYMSIEKNDGNLLDVDILEQSRALDKLINEFIKISSEK